MQLISTEVVEMCPCCGKRGTSVYTKLQDRVFDSPGEWELFECETCDVYWLNPRPIQRDREGLYANYYTHAGVPTGQMFLSYVRAWLDGRVLNTSAWTALRTDQQDVKSEPALAHGGAARWLETLMGAVSMRAGRARRSKLLRLMEIENLRPGRVLDIGCGSGEFLGTLVQLGWEGVGIEPDRIAAQYARERHGVTVFEDELSPETVEASAFDLVVLSHVIEHSSAPGSLLSESHRVLRPGGHLVLVTPNVRSLGHRIFGEAWRGLEPPRHMYLFSPRSLRLLTRAAGFREVSWKTSGREMRNIWFASRAIQLRNAGETGVPSFADYVESQAMGVAAGLASHVFKESGEEIFLVAEK